MAKKAKKGTTEKPAKYGARRNATSKRKGPATADALDIIDRRYYSGRPKRQAELEQARSEEAVGRQIYELRREHGLSQRALAQRVGTTASVICRLEDADYDGHSLTMLNRIAAALKQRVKVEFVPLEK